MFLIDKYYPQDEDDLIFHKNIYQLLKTMSEDESIPHVIFHGPSGSGKKLMLKLFLELLFDKTVNDTDNVTYDVISSGGKTTKEVIKQSNYHIIIDPKNTNFDRYLIHNIVKEYSKRMSLQIFKTNRTFKCVQINSLDNLSYYAQTALRRTIEGYSNRCKFIMWCNSLSKVIDPLKSRCICIRVPRPTEIELFKLLFKIAASEKLYLKLDDFKKICENSNCDIKKALWEIELKKFGSNLKLDYYTYLEKVVTIICSKEINSVEFNIARNHLFNIMITNIPGTKILKDLLDIILNKDCSDKKKIQVIQAANEVEYRLMKGRREIIHFDLFMSKVITIFK